VALSVMGVLLGAVLPVYSTMARREREVELIFRGEQYARAIRLYQQQFGNALPADVDVLLGMRFLRREYLDPITRDEFQYLGPNDPELAEALNSEPVGGRDDDEDESGGTGDASRGFVDGLGSRLGQGAAGGGMIAVLSKSPAESLRIYNGRDHYNEWVFMAVQQSQEAGTGAEGGEAGGRGRGGATIDLQPGGRGPRGGIGGRGGRGGRGDGGGRGGRGGFGGGGRGGRGF
jgi:type II secretory pathway pseudopilin PulG